MESIANLNIEESNGHPLKVMVGHKYDKHQNMVIYFRLFRNITCVLSSTFSLILNPFLLEAHMGWSKSLIYYTLIFRMFKRVRN